MRNSNNGEIYHLSDPILKHMGLVIAYWGALEAQIEFFILRNQGIPANTGILLTANLSYRAKADLLKTFASDDESLDHDEKRELKKIVSEADRLYGRRNLIAHASWLPTEEPNIANVKSVRTRGKLTVTDERIHVDELKKYATEIRDLGGRMLDFMERNGIRPEDGF